MQDKYKILMLSDHALSTSGVGCQSRFLIEGLVKKGCWTVRQFGAAIRHDNYDVVQINPDFVIKPIDGFGDRNLILEALATERPDVLLIFTDPRFFVWLWEMEDEIRGICPIAYWHVWDNKPFPEYNAAFYEATDLINCHSHLTYELVSEFAPEKTNFIPHSLPNEIYFPIEDNEVLQYKTEVLGKERVDHFVLFWINRNARRKRPADLLWAWSKFIQKIKSGGKEPKATLLLHTDPRDNEGPNLLAIAEHLDIVDSVVFSNQRIDFDKINVLHNISDACINISYAEGFGLATLESMQCGKPIIAVKTGGLTRQVVDHRDGTENGVALEVDFQSLVGSQTVPYIFEDYANTDSIADAIYKLWDMSPADRKELGQKAMKYVDSEFHYQKTVDLWHDSLKSLIENRKAAPFKRWSIQEVTK